MPVLLKEKGTTEWLRKGSRVGGALLGIGSQHSTANTTDAAVGQHWQSTDLQSVLGNGG